jgi:hypothetical protein
MKSGWSIFAASEVARKSQYSADRAAFAGQRVPAFAGTAKEPCRNNTKTIQFGAIAL